MNKISLENNTVGTKVINLTYPLSAILSKNTNNQYVAKFANIFNHMNVSNCKLSFVSTEIDDWRILSKGTIASLLGRASYVLEFGHRPNPMSDMPMTSIQTSKDTYCLLNGEIHDSVYPFQVSKFTNISLIINFDPLSDNLLDTIGSFIMVEVMIKFVEFTKSFLSYLETNLVDVNYNEVYTLRFDKGLIGVNKKATECKAQTSAQTENTSVLSNHFIKFLEERTQIVCANKDNKIVMIQGEYVQENGDVMNMNTLGLFTLCSAHIPDIKMSSYYTTKNSKATHFTITRSQKWLFSIQIPRETDAVCNIEILFPFDITPEELGDNPFSIRKLRGDYQEGEVKNCEYWIDTNKSSNYVLKDFTFSNQLLLVNAATEPIYLDIALFPKGGHQRMFKILKDTKISYNAIFYSCEMRKTYATSPSISLQFN